MPDHQRQANLISEQYMAAGNLNARILLHQRFSTNPYGWFRWVFDQIDLPFEARILEIGCGPGVLWLENIDRIPSGWQVDLSDFSPGMMRTCWNNLEGQHGKLLFTVFDAMEIPFPAETFDAVIANHMLYHLHDRQRALAGIYWVLKSGGKFYAATNGENHMKQLDEILNQDRQSAVNYFSKAFSAQEFTLENGMAQLAPWFSQIELHRYEDALLVTETDPLVAYIQSINAFKNIRSSPRDAANLRGLIDNLIQNNGSIVIQKDPGIFIAEKEVGV